MKSSELVKRLTKRFRRRIRDATQRDVRALLEALRVELHDAVERDETVLVPGILRLSVSYRAARRVKLPGREVDLPVRKRVKLQPQPALIGEDT